MVLEHDMCSYVSILEVRTMLTTWLEETPQQGSGGGQFEQDSVRAI
jgi:hypothetical protein